MAVLCEAISIIVRRDSIDKFFLGGWEGFLKVIPNSSMCTDGELVRIGFLDPKNIQQFMNEMLDGGLQFRPAMDSTDGIRSIDDIAVVDQMKGLTVPCDWIELARLPIGESKIEVLMCWLFEGERIASGIHMNSESMNLHTPEGWTPEKAIKTQLH